MSQVDSADLESLDTATGALEDQIRSVASAVERADASEAYELVGPLWLRLYDEKVATVGVPEVRDETLPEATAGVYTGLAGEQAREWVDESVETLAEAITAGGLSAISAATGLPAGLLEGIVQDEVEQQLQGERVSWEFGEVEPLDLGVTGGDLSLVATVSLDLTVEGTGVEVEAPIELSANVDAETLPATAEILDFSVRTNEIEID